MDNYERLLALVDSGQYEEASKLAKELINKQIKDHPYLTQIYPELLTNIDRPIEKGPDSLIWGVDRGFPKRHL